MKQRNLDEWLAALKPARHKNGDFLLLLPRNLVISRMPTGRRRWMRLLKDRRWEPPRPLPRDPGKKPKGAKDGWIGVVVERDNPDDRRSPGTMYVYGKQGYLGEFRTNENGFIGKSRGVSAGHYTLQPKHKSGKNWPAQTPAITGPGQPVGKPGPGYKADAILRHPEGPRGVPDSLSCITTNAEGFRRVMHVMHQAHDGVVPLIVA